ncbi:MAG: hypothetical protein HJJLKODD_00050 [Phycisphaerae bacterium]|nr:hypothetical protein [Phycisphaerae bacterium]
MLSKFINLMSIVFLTNAMWVMNALANPPEMYAVEYKIHADPYDFNSDVILSMTLGLSLVDDLGNNNLEWSIDQILITEYENQEPVKEWTDTNPTLGTWTVEHTDVDHPTPGEFINPPDLTGTASPSGNYNDLEYDFSASSSNLLTAGTGISIRYSTEATFSFVENMRTLAAAEEEEPVEVDQGETSS